MSWQLSAGLHLLVVVALAAIPLSQSGDTLFVAELKVTDLPECNDEQSASFKTPNKPLPPLTTEDFNWMLRFHPDFTLLQPAKVPHDKRLAARVTQTLGEIEALPPLPHLFPYRSKRQYQQAVDDALRQVATLEWKLHEYGMLLTELELHDPGGYVSTHTGLLKLLKKIQAYQQAIRQRRGGQQFAHPESDTWVLVLRLKGLEWDEMDTLEGSCPPGRGEYRKVLRPRITLF